MAKNSINKSGLLHSFFIVGGIIVSLLVIGLQIINKNSSNLVTSTYAVGTQPTDANLKIAFIGDSGMDANYEKVINLIKNEGAQAIMHVGDFDYNNDPVGFDGKIQQLIGTSIPYFGTVGNHDKANWKSPSGGYQAIFQKRSGTFCTGDNGNMATCNFKGLAMVELGIAELAGKDDATQVNYLKNALAQSNAIWKVCNWHEQMAAMQVGGKGDAVGWQVFEACREAGAIVMTGHEHSYHRTKTLINMQTQTVDPTCNSPTAVCVGPGKTFSVVSGLGGNSVRVQQRCLPATYPYGCNGEWAKIYTADQGATYGALFIVFNYQGDPYKAHGYFKNINGVIVDEFDIIASNAGGTPPPTISSTGSTPTPTVPVGNATPTPTVPAGCPKKNEGDADCNSAIDFVDLEIYRKELNLILTTKTADFNGDGSVTIADFEPYRVGYFKYNGITQTPPTPTTPIGNPTPTTPPTGCVTSSATWQNTAINAQSGSFTAEFDATPNGAAADIVMGFSSGPASAYANLASIARFWTTNMIEARNGAAYQAASSLTYQAGTSYHFKMVVNVSSHTYDLVVTPSGGSPVTIASQYAFRTEQATVGSLNNFSIVNASTSPTGKVCSLTVSGGSNTPTATPTPGSNPTPTSTPGQNPTITPTPGGPTPTIPTGAGKGMWISAAEIASRSTSNTAWNDMKAEADASFGTPSLSQQESTHPQHTLAAALVGARLNSDTYKRKAADAIASIIGTENKPDPDCGNSPKGARSLSLGRNLAPYVVAADVINFKPGGYDPNGKASQFRTWLSGIRNRTNCEGRTLITCQEERPNNWGAMCGASRIAADIYLGDTADLNAAYKIYKGFVGDRSSYASFIFAADAASWMCDTANPRPINPPGCTKDGHNLSGAQVDDVQREGAYTKVFRQSTNYPWGGFSATAAQAEMLYRAGFSDAYDLQTQAIKRGMEFLVNEYPNASSDASDWLPFIVNYHYNTSFPTHTSRRGFGRLMDWTAWTHAK